MGGRPHLWSALLNRTPALLVMIRSGIPLNSPPPHLHWLTSVQKVAELEAKVKQLESDVAAKQKEFDDLKKSGRVFDKRSFHPGYEWCRYYLIHFWYNGKEIHIKDQPQAFKYVYGILSSNKDGVWKSEDLGFPAGQAGVSITIRFYVYWKPWSEYSSKHLEYNAKTGDSYTVKELYPEPNF